MAHALLLVLLFLPFSFQTLPKGCSVYNGLGNTARVACSYIDKFPETNSFPINTTSIHVMHSNLISGLPTKQLEQLTTLEELVLQNNEIDEIGQFGTLHSLSNLRIDHNTIKRLEPGTFDNLTRLSSLSLKYNGLTMFPSFKKPSKLKDLYLEGNRQMKSLSRQSLQNLPALVELDLEETGIIKLPDGIFQKNKKLMKINLANTLTLITIENDAFVGATSLKKLILNNTRITSLPQQGLESITYLSLKDVPNFWRLPSRLWNLQEVHLNQYNGFLCCAFFLKKYKKYCTTQNPKQKESVPTLPASTTENHQEITTTLSWTGSTTGFPFPGGWGPKTTPSSMNTDISQPIFTFPSGGGGFQTQPPSPKTTAASSGGFPWPSVQSSTISSFTGTATTTSNGGGGGFWTPPSGGGGFGTTPLGGGGFGTTPSGGGGFGTTPSGGGGFGTTPSGGGGFGTTPSGGGGFGTHPPGVTTQAFTHKTFTWFHITGVHKSTASPPPVITGNKSNSTIYQCPDIQTDVKCYPEPDAFNPCEDIMGSTFLTVVSAAVGLVALLSNFVVGMVLITSQRRLNVTRFLMCNLAFADFCLGLYIFILTFFSIDTNGTYYNYVRTWQHGVGCKVLGFLAVFSSELSLFTLVVMTVERYYAIVYAMQLNTRLSFRWSVRVMLCGWVFSLLAAALPLLGASRYGMVAVCLPFDVTDAGSTAYVSSLLILNGCSFGLVIGLYARMLTVVVKGGDMEGAPKRNDKKVAKRMALLVFTDMACWAPIAFFGLLAALGVPLISVTDSKVLLVFFFPINSICNPFLYAFFTKAFKREFFSLLSRFGLCTMTARKYNGTLSSFLYSRSRRNHTYRDSNDDRLKRASTVSSPTQNDFKRISTVSSPSFKDFKTSGLINNEKESHPIENIEMNGISNEAYTPDSQTTLNSHKLVKMPSEDDDVFISNATAQSSKANSPKVKVKRVSVIENIVNEANTNSSSEQINSDTERNPGSNSNSPRSILKKTSVVSKLAIDSDGEQRNNEAVPEHKHKNDEGNTKEKV